MNTFKISTISLFLGIAQATNEFAPESNQDLFKLDDDDLIIPAKKPVQSNDVFINEDNLIKEAEKVEEPVEQVQEQ